MRENIRDINEKFEEKTENRTLNSINSRTWKNIFLFCIYKVYLISAEGYKNAEVDFSKIRKTDKIWVSMKNVHDGLGGKNMSDLDLK